MSMDSILQWNMQSYRTKFHELKLLLNEHTPLCMCLQETMIRTANIHSPSGYSIIHQPSDPDDGHTRGVAILVNKNVHHEVINLNTNLQALAVRITIHKTYTICTLYLPHQNVRKQDIQNLINQLPQPFLLLGDMNAHSPTWGSSSENERVKFYLRSS